MTTDKTPATLATVKHGGCVQLGSEERVRFDAWLETISVDTTRWGDGEYTDPYADNYWLAWQAALSAQPSPGGQDALVDTARRNIRQFISKASFSSSVDKQAALSCVDVLEEALAARQPVGEPVDDYDSAFQEAEPPPLVVNAAGFRALESFLTVAEEFRRSTEPYIEAINEGGSAGDDEISEVFDRHLNYAKTAVSRSTVYAAPPEQTVGLGQFRVSVLQSLLRCDDERQRGFISAEEYEVSEIEHQRLLALIDSQAVGNG